LGEGAAGKRGDAAVGRGAMLLLFVKKMLVALDKGVVSG
jgi:hypothetical protein